MNLQSAIHLYNHVNKGEKIKSNFLIIKNLVDLARFINLSIKDYMENFFKKTDSASFLPESIYNFHLIQFIAEKENIGSSSQAKKHIMIGLKIIYENLRKNILKLGFYSLKKYFGRRLKSKPKKKEQKNQYYLKNTKKISGQVLKAINKINSSFKKTIKLNKQKKEAKEDLLQVKSPNVENWKLKPISFIEPDKVFQPKRLRSLNSIFKNLNKINDKKMLRGEAQPKSQISSNSTQSGGYVPKQTIDTNSVFVVKINDNGGDGLSITKEHNQKSEQPKAFNRSMQFLKSKGPESDPQNKQTPSSLFKKNVSKNGGEMVISGSRNEFLIDQDNLLVGNKFSFKKRLMRVSKASKPYLSESLNDSKVSFYRNLVNGKQFTLIYDEVLNQGQLVVAKVFLNKEEKLCKLIVYDSQKIKIKEKLISLVELSFKIPFIHLFLQDNMQFELGKRILIACRCFCNKLIQNNR